MKLRLILDTSVFIAFYRELKMGYLLTSLHRYEYEILGPEYIVRNEIKTDLNLIHKAIE